MTVVRLMLAVLWLAFGIGATAHAAPAYSCTMSGMTHHHCHYGDGTPAAMPCCSQPAVIATPAAAIPVTLKSACIRPVPAPPATMVCADVRLEPRPPKVI